jgi:hypothetical protein
MQPEEEAIKKRKAEFFFAFERPPSFSLVMRVGVI